MPEDYAESVRLYRLAAEQGLTKAQFAVGFMYQKGHGVPKDYVLAYMWFNLAAICHGVMQSSEKAVENRDIVAGRMTPAQIAEAQRLAREWQEAH